jgi:5-methylthioadenosine/S-adenosylhomocysteine deaminase
MNNNAAIIEEGAVAVQGENIIAVGPANDLRGKYQAGEEIELSRGVVLPGLINSHVHTATFCLGDTLGDLSCISRLQQKRDKPIFTGDMAYWSALLSAVKMITTGTTSFCDMSVFSADVARAVEDIGIRGWLGEIIYDNGSCHGDLQDVFGYIDGGFNHYANHPLVTVTVSPDSVSSCSPELLVKLKSISQFHKSLYSIHLAETKEEVLISEDRYGNSPVTYLDSLGLLDDRVVVHDPGRLPGEDIEHLVDHNVKVIHCPSSAWKAESVIPVPQLMARDVTLGIGTDACNSSSSLDLFAEMDFAAKIHKVNNLDPTVVTAEQVLYMATRGGAEALGSARQIGSLEPGKKADIIVLDFDKPHLTPLYNIASHLVYAAQGADVIYSIINGRVIMRNRQLTTIDVSKILSKVRETTELFSV